RNSSVPASSPTSIPGTWSSSTRSRGRTWAKWTGGSSGGRDVNGPMTAATEGPGGARPVDWLLGGYNAIGAGIWLAAIGRSPAAPWIVAAHALGAFLPWGATIADRGANRLLRAARE